MLNRMLLSEALTKRKRDPYLHASAAVEVHVFLKGRPKRHSLHQRPDHGAYLYLTDGLLLSRSRLIDGHLDSLFPIRDDDRAKGGVVSVDDTVVHGPEAMELQHGLVPIKKNSHSSSPAKPNGMQIEVTISPHFPFPNLADCQRRDRRSSSPRVV